MNKKYKSNLLWVVISVITYLAAIYVIIISIINFSEQKIFSTIFIAVAVILLVLFIKDDLVNLSYVAMVDKENRKLFLSGKWVKRAVYGYEDIKKITLNYKDEKLSEIVLSTEEKDIATSTWTISKKDTDSLAEEIADFCKENEIECAVGGRSVSENILEPQALTEDEPSFTSDEPQDMREAENTDEVLDSNAEEQTSEQDEEKAEE